MGIDGAGHEALLVTGYGNTGAGAVMDIFRECDGFMCPAPEFFVIQHPDGVMALEDALVHSWTEFRPDWALRRFIELIDTLARPASRARFGQGYSRAFSERFAEISHAYVERLTLLEYEGHLMFRRAEMSTLQHLLFYFSERFGLDHRPPYRTLVAAPADKFLAITRAYFRELLQSFDPSGEARRIALFLGAAPYQAARCMSYFDRARTIIVDRDPRDVFISALGSTYMPRRVEDFIEWFSLTRRNAAPAADGQVLHLRFEDLIFDYRNACLRLFSFLGCDPSVHRNPQQHFVPGESGKRVMKWKSHARSDEIKLIEQKLPDYLYTSAL